jgi:hypothetical protein
MDKKIKDAILKIGAVCSERDFWNTEEPLTEIEVAEYENIKRYVVKFYYKNIAVLKSYRKFPKLWDENFEINKIKWLLIRHFKSKKIVV